MGNAGLRQVNGVVSADKLREARNDWSVTASVVVQLKERRSYKSVVSRYSEGSFVRQVDKVDGSTFFRAGTVGRYVGVLGRLETWSPPLAYLGKC